MSNVLDNIRSELSELEHLTKEELYEQCIDDRLKETVIKYDKDLDMGSRYLLQRAAVKVMKAITVIQKRTDVEILEANQEETNEEDIDGNN